MHVLAEKKGYCDLQFKWINADADREGKGVVIFNLNGFMHILAQKQGCCDLRFK